MYVGEFMADSHKMFVEKLLARGEEIYNPTNETMLGIEGKYPKVYVKSRPFPSVDFICGYARPKKDGTVTIIWDFGWYEDGFREDELGLCDPILFYKNSEYLKREAVVIPDKKEDVDVRVQALERKLIELERRISKQESMHGYSIK